MDTARKALLKRRMTKQSPDSVSSKQGKRQEIDSINDVDVNSEDDQEAIWATIVPNVDQLDSVASEQASSSKEKSVFIKKGFLDLEKRKKDLELIRSNMLCGLGNIVIPNFPDIDLGQNKYFSCTFSKTINKCAYYFRTGVDIVGNSTIVKLSEAAFDMLIGHAEHFIKFVEHAEEIRQLCVSGSVSKIDLSLQPTPVVLEILPETQEVIAMDSFIYTGGSGVGVVLRVVKEELFRLILQNEKKFFPTSKQFIFTGVSFLYFILGKAPVVQEMFESMEETLAKLIDQAGGPNIDSTQPVEPWRKIIGKI